MDLKSIQKPLKDSYREDPSASRITLTAGGERVDTPVVCENVSPPARPSIRAGDERCRHATR